MDYAPFHPIAQHACTAVLAEKFLGLIQDLKIVASMKNLSTGKTYCCHCRILLDLYKFPVQSNTVLPTPITLLKALADKF